MKLNCDLGESYGAWQMNQDDLLMPYVDMASIACGYHAGDPLVMQKAIMYAKANGVSIGAHPSYPDRQGFGRRSMHLTQEEIITMLHYQVAALDGMATVQGETVKYIKPHGAMYNDMMASREIFSAVLLAVQQFPRNLPLVVQAKAGWQAYQDLADQFQVALIFEAFADRSYLDDGSLMPRSQVNSVLALPHMLKQVEQLIHHGIITTNTGKSLTLKVDTLCVHGDSSDAIDAVKQIRSILDAS